MPEVLARVAQHGREELLSSFRVTMIVTLWNNLKMSPYKLRTRFK